VDLSDVKACRQFDFSIRPIARASGLVVDASGRPLAGVSIDAVAAELAGFDPLRYQYPITTDDHGAFEFTDLPVPMSSASTLRKRRTTSRAAVRASSCPALRSKVKQRYSSLRPETGKIWER
jgi:hypothetical protein